MYVLFIILNDLTFLEPILKRLVELKVRGATIIDSEGMAAAITRSEGLHSLIFNSIFDRNLDKDQGKSKTIFTVIPDSDQVSIVADAVKEIVGVSKRQVIGFMFTIPVAHIIPLKPKK